MSAQREARGSDVFRFECDDCGKILRVRTDTSVDAVLHAARRRWTFAGRHDRCPACKPAPRKGAATRARRA